MKKSILLLLPILILLAILGFYYTRPYEPEVSIVRTSIIPDMPLEQARTYLNGKPVDLVFFFQGVANDIVLPYSYSGLNLASEKKIYRDDLIFISFDYNRPLHWSSPNTVFLTIKAIKYLISCFNVRSVKIIGISMGGALALDVLSRADLVLKSKISDVLVVYPVIDYKYTLANTKRKSIHDQLLMHFFSYRSPLKLMRDSSPITFYKSISKTTNITILEGVHDTHVCSDRIESYYEKIKSINKNVKLLKWEVDHSLMGFDEQYKSLVLSILN